MSKAAQKIVVVLGTNPQLVQRCATALRAQVKHQVAAAPPHLTPQVVAEELGDHLATLVTVVDLGQLGDVFAARGLPESRLRAWFAQVESCDVLVCAGAGALDDTRLLSVLQPSAPRLSFQALESGHALPAFSAKRTGNASGVYQMLLLSSLQPGRGRSDSAVDDRNVHVYRARATLSSSGWRQQMRAWPRQVARAFGRVSLDGRVFVVDQCGAGVPTLIDEDEQGDETELVLLGTDLDRLRLRAWFDQAFRPGLAEAK